MSRYFILLIAAGVLLVDGYLCGRCNGRWHEAAELTQAAKVRERLPLTCGTRDEWQGKDLEPLDARTFQIAGFNGYLMRQYQNQRTRAVVSVFVAWGRPGPLSVHTPEVCYGGVGYALEATKRWSPRVDAGDRISGDFWTSTFSKNDSGAPKRLKLIWSLNKHGVWLAPDHPRWTLADAPVVFKVYVSQEYFQRGNATDRAPEAPEDFLRAFLPQLNQALANES